jgi:hypothetical protein
MGNRLDQITPGPGHKKKAPGGEAGGWEIMLLTPSNSGPQNGALKWCSGEAGHPGLGFYLAAQAHQTQEAGA